MLDSAPFSIRSDGELNGILRDFDKKLRERGVFTSWRLIMA